MKLLSKRFGRRAVFVAIFGLTLLFGFQNCGKAGFDSVDSALLGQNPNGATAVEAAAPFAYKASFDTIAYNSCFGTTLAGKTPYFTFRGGAYQSAGVKINKSFMDYARSKLSPSYPNPKITPAQFKNLLANSTKNKDAQLLFSVRQLSNLKDPSGIYRTGNTPTVGVDYYNVLGPLSDERWLDSLMIKASETEVESDFLRYFLLAPRNFRNVEVSHIWNADEALAQQVRSAFISDAALTLTVQDPDGTNGKARGPISAGTPANAANPDPGRAYGTGYKLNFGVELPAFTYSCTPIVDTNVNSPTYKLYVGCPASTYVNPAPDYLNPNNILSSVQEIDLETSVTSTSTWSCNPNMRFIVVRPSDQVAICPRGEDALNLQNGVIPDTAGYYADLEKVRRVLPADQWDVNLTRRCAVPKEGDCYSDEKIDTKLVRVQYDVTKTCFQALDGVGYTTTPIELCAQHVSICTK